MTRLSQTIPSARSALVKAKADIPSISGLDMKAALHRMGGNAKLLIKLIRRFRETQSDVMTRIASAMQRGDTETAVREAHTVKGLSGNLGDNPMFEIAGKVEHMLKEGEIAGLPESIKEMELRLADKGQ